MAPYLVMNGDCVPYKDGYCHYALVKSLKIALFARFLVEFNKIVINFSKTLANEPPISIINPTDTATAAQYAL
ncbi:conserved protein of unknown function [Moritella yayanosii]|uniref:Uncharacterized protein n=1 Tax=Moritella yayanosii TaxID=69539 RepID=A0A330LTF4_9GAMM|nr:conserved protein of unknown function [Moritella yayanosii]